MTTSQSISTHPGKAMARPSQYEVEDLYWGYIIRARGGPKLSVAIGQAVSFFLGTACMTAALGILILPALLFDGGVGAMRVGAATLFGAASAYLLWFASRGTQPEVQVDTNLAEIREVICNRAGRPTTIASYRFEGVSGIMMSDEDETGTAELALQYHDSDRVIIVASAPTAQLIPLRNRLASDLLDEPHLQAVAA